MPNVQWNPESFGTAASKLPNMQLPASMADDIEKLNISSGKDVFVPQAMCFESSWVMDPDNAGFSHVSTDGLATCVGVVVKGSAGMILGHLDEGALTEGVEDVLRGMISKVDTPTDVYIIGSNMSESLVSSATSADYAGGSGPSATATALSAAVIRALAVGKLGLGDDVNVAAREGSGMVVDLYAGTVWRLSGSISSSKLANVGSDAMIDQTDLAKIGKQLQASAPASATNELGQGATLSSDDQFSGADQLSTDDVADTQNDALAGGASESSAETEQNEQDTTVGTITSDAVNDDVAGPFEEESVGL